MAFFERNLDSTEAMTRVAAGFAAMIIGLFIMILDFKGVVVSAVGLYAFGEGYHRWSLLRALRSGR